MQPHCADQSDSAMACEQVCGPPSKDDSGLHDVAASQTLSLGETEKERHSGQLLQALGESCGTGLGLEKSPFDDDG